MKKITLLLALVCSVSIFATRYLVQTGAPGAATWRAAGAGEVSVNLTATGQSLTQWLTATTFTSGNQVWIAAGTYNVTSTYAFPTAGLSIFGGFGGNESDPSERTKGDKPWSFTNETLIYGNLATQIFSPGGARAGSLIDGLSITRGGNGGSCGVVLRDGITLQNCYFYGNVSTGNGGAILMNGGGNVYNSYFYGNTGNSGGAIHCGTGSGLTSTISNCLFENNSASGGANNLGGALRSQAAGRLNVNNSIFINNTAVANGSAVHIQLGAVSETQNTILTNCLLYGNTSKSALYMLGGILQNSTVVNNEVGGVYVASATITTIIYNSVFWGAASSGAITSIASNASAVIQNTAYRSIQSANFTGTNNINNILLDAENTGTNESLNYPEFINPTTNNWELGYKSALLNTGKTIASVTADYEGITRPQGPAYDIGAYELAYYNTTVTFNTGGTVTFNSNGLTSGDILEEPKGKQLIFNITPSSGQLLLSVKYNGSTVTTVDNGNGTYTYTTPSLSANGDLDVEFKAITQLNITSGILSTKGYTETELAQSHFTLTSGELIVDESASIHSLTLTPSSKLTISAGTLTTTNGITLQSDATGTATIKNSGTYSGNVTAQQYLGSARNWYVSGPVSSATAPASNVDYYYEYVESGDNDPSGQPGSSTVYWKGLATGSPMAVGKGYIAKANAATSITFAGTPNNGNITTVFDLTRNESAGKGFNLVGNPYPSYIDWMDVAVANPNLDNTYYYRTKNTDNGYTFVTYNGAGSGSYVVGNGTANTSITRFIPPTQAFWVRVKSGTSATRMYFNNDMREHRDDNGNLMKAPQQVTRTSVRLQLQSGIQADELLIYRDAGASNDFDNYDSPKMMNNSTSVPDFYSIVGDEQLVINGLNSITENMDVQLGFSLKSAAALKIKATELNNLPEGMNLYLLDKSANTQTQLTTETEYSFTTTESTTNNESRFSLVFKSPGITTSADASEYRKMAIFVNAQNELVIIAPENSSYAIYTMVGEQIKAGIVTENAVRINSVSKGVYLVKVNNQASKVIIR